MQSYDRLLGSLWLWGRALFPYMKPSNEELAEHLRMIQDRIEEVAEFMEDMEAKA